MRKICLFLLISIMLCGCTKKPMSSDNCEFLINASWEGNDSQCVNVITFKQNGGFANWCYCGSEVGDADSVDKYCYRASDQAILLLDNEGKVIETGQILYADDWYLVIDLWTRCYVYENADIDRPRPHVSALECTGIEELTKPYLRILSYEDGVVKVTSHDYDKDSENNYPVWELKVSEHPNLAYVNVTIEQGDSAVEVGGLPVHEYGYIGEQYTHGYVEINRDGEVSGIVFYGENIAG